MNDTDIIENLRGKLATSSGRHLYAVLGTYTTLQRFAQKIQQASTPEGRPFPAPLSVTRGILATIPDNEFRDLVEKEARRPETIAAHIKRAFEEFLRTQLRSNGLVVLSNMEILFAYQSDLWTLRVLGTDAQRIIMLLPGKRENGMIKLFLDEENNSFYPLPQNLIAENHLWELKG